MNEQTKKKDRPNCFTCRFFFITHEAAHPYGCRAMGFKSKKIPVLVVFESSGLECQLHEKK
ncbi:MAG: uracil-DNA glycosylase [Deltaproteobacteria bacterium]|nr:uracil-DNA glycosylase [Deltaproteobacteria bacterium]